MYVLFIKPYDSFMVKPYDIVSWFCCPHMQESDSHCRTYQKHVGPKIWCKPRSTEWWTRVITGLCCDEWWRENLRMTRETFERPCNELRPHIERQNKKKSVTEEVRVEVTI